MKYTSRQIESIQRGLCSYVGARQRWAELAERGASDDEVRKLIAYEFGLGGGSAGPDVMYVVHQPNPLRMELSESCGDRPVIVLQGAELICAARLVFGITRPKHQLQLDLFEVLP